MRLRMLQKKIFQRKLQYFFCCYDFIVKSKKKYINSQNKINILKRLVYKMHFMSRVFSNATSLMTPVCMLYVGAMAASSYLSNMFTSY